MIYKISDYLTIAQASAFLGISKNTLRNWEKNKKLIPLRHPVNRYRLYKLGDLERFLTFIEEI
jgi:DNA (cytosine-5)-methyltransferase 1